MTASEPEKRGSIGGIGAPAGETFFTVLATLTNEGVQAGVPENLVFFSLETADHISTTSSIHSASLADGCDAMKTVEVGGTATCRIAFQIPATADAITLHYDGAGVSASAAVPALMAPTGCGEADPPSCQGVCIKLFCCFNQGATCDENSFGSECVINCDPATLFNYDPNDCEASKANALAEDPGLAGACQ